MKRWLVTYKVDPKKASLTSSCISFRTRKKMIGTNAPTIGSANLNTYNMSIPVTIARIAGNIVTLKHPAYLPAVLPEYAKSIGHLLLESVLEAIEYSPRISAP